MGPNHPEISNETRDRRPPIVSVIIPTYNRLVLLREAVDSVRAQTFADWELIIADDGSTDGTRPYLERLALEDTRIRPLFLNHAGSMTVMRTEAIRVMRGEWIALLDSDDLWAPRKLEVQLGQLGAHPECGWSYTGYHHIDTQGNRVAGRTAVLPCPISGWIVEELITLAVASAPQTLMVRRSLFHQAGGFDPRFYVRSDYDLMLRLATRSQAFGVPDDLAMVREHATRTTNGFPILRQLMENEAMFRNAAVNAADSRIRSLCARQRCVQYVGMARIHSREGRYIAACGALIRAVSVAPLSRQTWRSTGGYVVRQLGLRA